MKRLLAIFTPALLCSLLLAEDIDISHSIIGGGVDFAVPASVSMGADQAIAGAAGGAATIEAVSATPFTVSVLDKRGVSQTLAIQATLTPLTNGNGTVRPTSVVAGNAGGEEPSGVTFAAPTTATTSTPVDIAAFVEALGAVNRSFSFDVTLSAGELTGAQAESGTYTGTLTLTLQ